MRKYMHVLALPFLPCLLFAASGSGEVDIIERTINFVIFFALIYYFAADKIKAIFRERRDGIASSLAKIQEKLQESKKEKQKAIDALEEAKRLAKDMVDTAHKESSIITHKIEENTKIELESLERQFNENMAFERRKIEKSVVGDILNEFLNQDSVALKQDVLAQALLKKVA